MTTLDFIKREIDWIGVPLKENKPFLGICLGGQMLARHLGGRVDFHGEGHVEVGYYPIRPTLEGRAICEVWPDHVYQWHREGFDLPPGATLLAEGDTFPVQAFRQGEHAYAHPVSPGSHARDDVPLDHPRRSTAWNCRAPSSASRISRTASCSITRCRTGCRISSSAGSPGRSLRRTPAAVTA